MSNKVDKLFKEKLEEHSLQPSAQAWEKVEAHIGKKNKMVLWLRVAAAVMLLGVLTFAALNWNNGYEAPKEQIVNQESGVGSQEEGVKKSEEKVASNNKKSEVRSQKSEAGTQHSGRSTRHLAPGTQSIKPIAEEPVEQIAIVPEPAIIPELPAEPTVVKATKGITLTYSLPTKKQTAPVEPMIADVKKTGFERVIEIAKEVKNGDNPMGELRQAKDDIFALDFKKDKDKTKKY